jgi:hypothetical protein
MVRIRNQEEQTNMGSTRDNLRATNRQYSRPTPEQIVPDGLSYKYTQGGEFTTMRGEEYIGEYHIRKDGKTYTGPRKITEGRDDSEQLLPYYEFANNFAYDRLNNFVSPVKDQADPVPYEYVVREEEGVYEDGYDTRSFVQKRGKGTYPMEIDQLQRDRFGSRDGIDARIYNVVDIRWQLTGTLEAIERVNKERVSRGSLIIPDLPLLIRNYTQYARPTKQTQFNSLDADLRTKDKLIKGKNVPIRQTIDRETGLIITPIPYPNR